MKRASILIPLALALCACSPATGGTSPRSLLDESSYCELAARDGEVRLEAGIASVCAPIDVDAAIDAAGVEAEGPAEACSHQRVGSGGALEPLDLPGVRTALATPDGGLVLSMQDGRLVSRGADGVERELAAWAGDPSLFGRRLAYVAAPAGALIEEDGPAIGTPLEVVLEELGGRREVLTTDPDAATPFALPDGSGVIFVSTRTGIASIFRADRDGTRQLTNLGAEDTGQDFVPIPTGTLAWVPGSLRAVYAAEYDDARVWMLDAASGEAEELGPGRLPEIDGDAVRVAVSRSGEPTCARRIPHGERP